MTNGETAYIGIDPGMSKQNPGAAALLVDDGFVAFYDWHDPNSAADVMRLWGDQYKILGITIEKVWARPGEGHTSKLLENFGFWQGVARIICRPDLYKPKEWQQIIPNHFKGKAKEKSIAAAKFYFPEIKPLIYLKKHAGRADALLICEYGKRMNRFKKGV